MADNAVLSVKASAPSVVEGQPAKFLIERQGDMSGACAVEWVCADLNGVLNFDPSDVTRMVAIPTANMPEQSENRQVTLTLSKSLGAELGTASATVTIEEHDGGSVSPIATSTTPTSLAPTIGVGPFMTQDIVEGQTVTMVVTRSAGGQQAVTFDYAFTSSLHPFDFADGAVTSGQATLPANTATMNLIVATRDRSGADQGTRTITCTMSNPSIGSIGSATATNTLVDAATASDGTTSSTAAAVLPSDLPKYQPDVPVGKWHCVGFTQAGCKAEYGSGRAGFASAVGAANLDAGDVIVLDDGTYSGASLTCSKNAAAGDHIMVRARNHGKAAIDCQLFVTGSYWWFTGIKFTYNRAADPSYHNDTGRAVINRNDGLWVTNCKFTGHAFINIQPNTTNLRFCYNDVAATTPADLDVEDTGVFLTMICQSDERPPGDSEIAWNKVTLFNEVSQGGTKHGRHFLICHPSHSTGASPAFVQRGFKIHHNHAVGPWAEVIYCKRNICTEFNYFEWSGGKSQHDMTYRHGLLTNSPAYDIGGIIRGNRFKSSDKVTIELNGAGICVANNINEGNSGGIEMYAGNTTTPWRDGCGNAQLVENTGFGSVEVGKRGKGNIGSENAAGRNGVPGNVRIFKGDSNWNPNVTYGAGSSSSQVTTLNGYGTGNAAKCATIKSSDLLTGFDGTVPKVGCDSMP